MCSRYSFVGYLLFLLIFTVIGDVGRIQAEDLVPFNHTNNEFAQGLSPEHWVETVEAEVMRVIDGDTIEVRLDGQIQSVRYLGIDAPEIDWNRGQHQVYALEAAQANRELVSGEWVRLVFDTMQHDIYGRLLAHVFIGDLHVNHQLIEQGYAQTLFMAPNLQFHEVFLAAQRDACLFGRGLWGTLGHPISVHQVPEYVGTFQIIEGEIVQGQQRARDGLTELHLSDDSNGVELFYIHIYPESRTFFDTPPEVALVGSRVQVIGLIEHYGRGYRLVVRDPAMLTPLHSRVNDLAICGG